MSERKVLNKYFPPNFDPSLIKRIKRGKERQQVVRLMAPFSMRCTTCGEYIYKGKKFNARKETVEGEDYYGIKIFRFYIKCTRCSSEITFKTDPKNTDYVSEHGAARNFEPWRTEVNITTDQDRLDQLELEENDPMAALENKALDSKREMEILDGLQELKSRNARIERAGRAGVDNVLDRVSTGVEVGDREVKRKLDEFEEQQRKEMEEDEEEIRRVFGKGIGMPDIVLENIDEEEEDTPEEGSPNTPRDEEPFPGSSTSTGIASIKRKLDDVEPTATELLSSSSKAIISKPATASIKKKKANELANKLGIKVKAKK